MIFKIKVRFTYYHLHSRPVFCCEKDVLKVNSFTQQQRIHEYDKPKLTKLADKSSSSACS